MSEKRIFRTEKGKTAKGFVRIENALLQDERLSYRARGVAASLLSRPDDWRFNASDLAVKNESEHCIANAIKELRIFGYILRIKKQGVDGRWKTTLFLYEQPTANNCLSAPTGEKPTVGKLPVLQTTEETNKCRKVERTEKSSSFQKDEVVRANSDSGGKKDSGVGTVSNPMPLPKSLVEVKEAANQLHTTDEVAEAFYHYQTEKNWTIRGKRLINWKKALEAFAKSDAKRVVRPDHIDSKTLRGWAEKEGLDHASVEKFISLMKVSDGKLKNKMTGRMEPVTDMREACRRFCHSDLNQELVDKDYRRISIHPTSPTYMD